MTDERDQLKAHRRKRDRLLEVERVEKAMLRLLINKYRETAKKFIDRLPQSS